jgi:hypothetical protein
MQQLFPSSQELAKYKILADGVFDLSQGLQKLADLAHANVSIEAPRTALTLKWSEVRPPRQQDDFAQGLLGNRLKIYYFQYLAQFMADEKQIEAAAWQHAGHKHAEKTDGKKTDNKDCAEMFSTDLEQGNAVRAFFGGTGFFNATWLLDFLMNPSRCIARGEKLTAKATGKGYAITLSSDNKRTPKETETFLFKADFSAMQWEHISQF